MRAQTGKGIANAMEASRQEVVSNGASDLCAGLRLAIVGSGPMIETLQEMSVEFGVQDRCHFEPSTADVAK